MDYEDSTEVSNPDAPQIAITVKQMDLKQTSTPTSMDFAASSEAWMANKVRKGYVYAYRCAAFESDGRRCRNAPAKNPVTNSLCRRHLKESQTQQQLATCLRQQEEVATLSESIRTSVTERVWLNLAEKWKTAATHSLELNAVVLEEGGSSEAVPEFEYLVAFDKWKTYLLPEDCHDLPTFYEELIHYEHERFVPSGSSGSRIDNVPIKFEPRHFSFPWNYIYFLPLEIRESQHVKEMLRLWLQESKGGL